MSDQELSQKTFSRFLTIHHHLRSYERKMHEHGVRPRQFSFLRKLSETGPASVGSLQQFQHTSASAASTLIAQLEDGGFVTRSRSESDNRVVIVELTKKGAAVAKKAPMGGLPLFRRKLTTLDEKQLNSIYTALGEIMALMEVDDRK